MVRTQQAQAGFQIAAQRVGRGCQGFCGEGNLVAHPLKGQAELFLTVMIGAGGVKKRDAAVKGSVQQPHGVLRRDTLDRYGAKCIFADRYAGTS